MLIERILANLLPETTPERARLWLLIAQVGLGGAFIGGFWWIRNREQPSGFRLRESDRLRAPGPSHPVLGASASGKPQPPEGDLGTHRMRPRKPLQLSGISLSGEPHEILGVVPGASPSEIQKAYRDLMKRYHPDMVGRPGSREWTDAQKIAEAINQAKEALLSSRRQG